MESQYSKVGLIHPSYLEESSQHLESAANNAAVRQIIRSYTSPSSAEAPAVENNPAVVFVQGELVEDHNSIWNSIALDDPLDDHVDEQEVATTTIELVLDDTGVISTINGDTTQFFQPTFVDHNESSHLKLLGTDFNVGFENRERSPNLLDLECHTKLEPKLFGCPTCGKHFTKKSNLKNHQGIHIASQRKFKCSQCLETFAWKSSLNRHVSKHHTNDEPQSEVQCSYCDKKYKVMSILNDHIKRDHMNERKHQCDLCPKSFFKVNDLKYHKRLHLSIKPYACSTCGKRFSHLSHCYRHERIHSGDKPFSCNICGKSFNQTNALKTHLKIHNKDSSSSAEQPNEDVTFKVPDI